MIIDNGVDPRRLHSWTVRFYDNGVADYVTVNNQLPVNAAGTLVFDGYGTSTSAVPRALWIALIEKAYAQWNQTGKEGRDGRTATPHRGRLDGQRRRPGARPSATSYDLSSTSDQRPWWRMTAKMAVTIGTDTSNNCQRHAALRPLRQPCLRDHRLQRAAGTFTFYNPWGVDQPTQALTWAQLQTVTDGFVVANASQTKPIAGSTLRAAIGPALAPQLAGSVLSSAQPVAAAASAPPAPRRVFDRGRRGVAQALRGLGNRRPAVFALDGQRGRSSGRVLGRRGRRDPGRSTASCRKASFARALGVRAKSPLAKPQAATPAATARP